MSGKSNKTIRKPIDPTEEPQELMNETDGLTGITQNHQKQETITQKELHNTPISGENRDSDSPQATARSMSEEKYNSSLDMAEGIESEKKPTNYKAQSDPHKNFEDNIGIKNPSPDEKGELSSSGTQAHVESDDDTLEMAHGVGLRLTEDEDNRQEIDIGSDIDRAEEHHRTH